jgi:hypothetical protein
VTGRVRIALKLAALAALLLGLLLFSVHRVDFVYTGF